MNGILTQERLAVIVIEPSVLPSIILLKKNIWNIELVQAFEQTNYVIPNTNKYISIPSKILFLRVSTW